MRTYYFCNILLVVSALLLSAACARRPRVTPAEKKRVPQLISAPGRPALQQPVIRIGLKTDLKSTVVGADKATYFSDGDRSKGITSKVVVSVSFLTEIPIRYSVQVASFSSRENAVHAQKTLAKKVRHPNFIFENKEMRMFQLRLGPFPNKEKAQQVIEDVKTGGYPNAFYVAEDKPAGELPEVTLRDELGNALLRTRQPVTIWTDDLTIEVDQARYRGYLTVFVNYTGRLTVVNISNMEEYLKGVVPGEIGPASHSNFEALKAQAVAARTYAYKNLKQFDAEGYDLCPTPRCQVYSGIKIEHPLTSQAVEETKGEVVRFGGDPINALYTSTCGGHTENAEIMFEGWDYPYLKGVECYPEEETSYTRPTTIRGQSLDWSAAWVQLKTGTSSAPNQSPDLTVTEAETTTAAVLRYLGKTPCASQTLKGTSWIDIGDYLVEQLCWKTRRDSLLDEKDYRYFLSRISFSFEDSPQTHSFLFLLHDELMTPDDLYRFNPHLPMSKSEFFETLYGILDHYHQINTKKGQIREINRDAIQLVDDQGVHSYSYSNGIYLFQKIGEDRNPHTEIGCSAGDNIEYALANDHIVLLACEFDRRGVAMDRSSTYTFWRQSYTPRELGDKVSRYLSVGDVLDLQPLTYGASKRIHELKVTGTLSSGVLRGIRIRWALGLRDNLFTIDRVFGANGVVSQFVFTGRGWGHGLGMCQVGALGYAKQGKDYRWILRHYYTGVDIAKIY